MRPPLRDPAVPFRRKYVRDAAAIATLTVIVFVIGQAIASGWSTGLWIIAIGYFAVLVVGYAWASWSGDKSDVRVLRAFRRPARVHATRPKVR